LIAFLCVCCSLGSVRHVIRSKKKNFAFFPLFIDHSLPLWGRKKREKHSKVQKRSGSIPFLPCRKKIEIDKSHHHDCRPMVSVPILSPGGKKWGNRERNGRAKIPKIIEKIIINIDRYSTHTIYQQQGHSNRPSAFSRLRPWRSTTALCHCRRMFYPGHRGG